MSPKDAIKDDLWRGAREIAEGTGEKVFAVYRMCEAGELPAFKMNGKWYMRPSRYLRRLEELETGKAT